ncbi:MAG: DAK2 domain-containing protein [Chloroflexi bacterium]|nr:DAK2 domain-containing protein [Chloroflexota bacterium]
MQSSTTTEASTNAALLIKMIRAAVSSVEANRDTINALNVFPVPDGDTGTNMVLTLRSVIEDLPDHLTTPVPDITKAMARAALLGARGNSGLILSQFFKGLAEAVGDSSELSGRVFASALRIATKNSYRSVPNPVEGTMLTVYRECADEATKSVGLDNPLETVLANVAARSLDTVRRTPEMLPVLAEAEVVDSGGFGFAVMLDGALRALLGTDPAARVVRVPMPGGTKFSGSVKTDFVDASVEIDWGYCTVFAIQSDKIDLEKLRAHMDRIGRSPIVDGTDGIAKVHVHMEDPGKALSAGLEYGQISNIEIANMDQQAAGWAADRRNDSAAVRVRAGTRRVDPPDIAIVAVAAGDGLANLIVSAGLGVTSIVEGGDTMNPSVADLLAAVEAAPSGRVILLPNNKNVVAAAQQVPELTEKEVRVVPTRSVQTGVAALLAFNMEFSLDENVEAMTAVAGEVGEGRVCQASRDVTIYGHEIKNGMTFAIFDDEIVSVGRDPLHVLIKLIEGHSEDAEIITVYTGESVSPDQVAITTESLENKFEHLEIEVVYGGQPHYDYLVAVE